MTTMSASIFYDSDLSSLKEVMDTLDFEANRSAYSYRLDLGELVSPREVEIIFTKARGAYIMATEDIFSYTGQNAVIKRLAKERCVAAESWIDFCIFLRVFGGGDFLGDDGGNRHINPTLTSPTPRPESQESAPFSIANIDVNSATDFSAVSLPAQRNSTQRVCAADLEEKLSQVVMGQETQIKTVAYMTAQAVSKKNPKKPLSFLFSGPPGVGKSETAKALSSALTSLSGREYSTVKVDLNTYTEAHSVYNLLGAPASYVGHDETPILAKVQENPYTVMVLDELDKAHPEVLKVFMSILDEGRCIANKPLSDGSVEYRFEHAILIFTSNYNLTGEGGEYNKRPIGFSVARDIRDLSISDDAVSVSYEERSEANREETSFPMKIYRRTEAARKEFVEVGVLREIASRFQCFVNFDPLSDEAKCRILAKQIIEAGFEYGIAIAYISPSIMQGIVDAAMSGEVLTVRSFKPIIDGYLASSFSDYDVDTSEKYRLEGELASPSLIPMN